MNRKYILIGLLVCITGDRQAAVQYGIRVSHCSEWNLGGIEQ